jgi:hypothetical protein
MRWQIRRRGRARSAQSIREAIGPSLRPVQDWEQGRHKPETAARAHLLVGEKANQGGLCSAGTRAFLRVPAAFRSTAIENPRVLRQI